MEGWRTWSAYPGITDLLHSPWRSATLHGTEFATWQSRTKTARCQGGELLRSRRYGARPAHPDHATPVDAASGNTGYSAPAPECTCGIGVLTSYDALLDRMRTFTKKNKPRPIPGCLNTDGTYNSTGCTATIITGRIRGYGTIMNRGRKSALGLDTSELRCEHAEILELWIPADAPGAADLANSFRSRYSVPVHIGFPDRIDNLPASADVRSLIENRDLELAAIPPGTPRNN